MRQSLNSLLEGMGSGTEADLIKQRINLLLDYEKVRGKMSDMQKAEIDAELTILDYLHEKHLLTEATNQALLELIDAFINIKEINKLAKQSDIDLLAGGQVIQYQTALNQGQGKDKQYSTQETLALMILANETEQESLSIELARLRAQLAIARYEELIYQRVEKTSKALGGIKLVLEALNQLKDTEKNKTLENTNLTNKQLTQMKSVLEAFSLTLPNEEMYNPTIIKINQLTQEIENGNITWEEFRNRIINIRGDLEYAATEAGIMAEGFSKTDEEIKLFGNACEKAGQSAVQFAQLTLVINDSVGLTNAIIEKNSKGVDDWATRIVNAGKAFTSISMIMSSVTSLGDTFDEFLKGNMTAILALTRSLSSLGMIIPGLVLGFNALKNSALAATIAAKLSISATSAAVGAGLAIITVVKVIEWIVKALDDLIVTLKEASLAIIDANAAYDELKLKLEESESALKSILDRLEELLALEAPTLAEKEEIKKLLQENDLLERLLEILRELTKKEAFRNADTFIQNHKKSSELFEDYYNGNKHMIEESGHSSGGYGAAWVYDYMTAEQYKKLYIDNIEDLSVEEYDIRLNKYKEYLDQEEKLYREVLDEHKEDIEGLELGYKNLIDTYLTYKDDEDNPITEEDVEEALSDLKKLAMFLIGPSATEALYLEIYIKPLLDDTAVSEARELIYQLLVKGTDGWQDALSSIPEDLEEYLLKAGVSVEDFLKFIDSGVEDSKDRLSKLIDDAENHFDELTAEDWEIIAELDLTGIDTWKELLILLEAHKNNVISIVLDFKGMKDSAREALATIAEGEFLDDETIQALKEKFASIYDFSNLEDLSLYDQSRAISEALILATDPSMLLNQLLEESKSKLEDINEQIHAQLVEYQEVVQEVERATSGQDEYRKKLQDITETVEDLNKEKIELEIDTEKAEAALEELGDKSEILLEFEVDTAMIDAVVGQMGAIEKAASLIGEGFKVEAENVQDLMRTMPQLFEDATIDIQTGMVQLQEEIVNKVAETTQAEVALTAEGLKLKLTNRYNEIQSEIDLLNLVKLNAYAAGQSEVTSARAFNNMEQLDKIKIVQAIVKARMQLAVLERTQSAQSASNAIQDLNKVREASEKQGSLVALNWQKTAQAAATAMYQFAKNAIANLNAIRSENGTAIPPSISLTGVGTSGNASELSWNYDTTAGSQFQAVNKWLQNGLLIDAENELVKTSLANELSVQLSLLGFNLSSVDLKRGTDAVIDAFVLNNYPTWEAFLTDANAALSDKFYELGIVGTDLSKLLSGINSGKLLQDAGTKKGSSKKSSSSKGSELDPKELEERYHEINKLIEELERLLKDVQTLLNRTYGAAKLQEYNKELQRLNDLVSSTTEKMKEAEEWSKIDLEKIKSLNLTPELSEDGRILNYTKLLQQAVDEYNQFIALWNSHKDDVAADNEQTWQKIHEDEKEAVEKLYKDRLDALKKFEESVETYWEEFEKREQYLRDIEDNKLAKIRYVIEFQIDYKDAKKDVRNLAKTIEEAIGDALDHGMKTAVLDYQNMLDEMNMKTPYDLNFSEILAKIEESRTNPYIDQEELASQLENLRDNVIQSAEALVEWAESIEEIVPDAIDAARERFEVFIDLLEHNTSIIDTIKEIMILQGNIVDVKKGYDNIRDLYTKRMDATLAEAKLNRQWYDRALQLLTVALNALDSAQEGTQQYDILRANRDALLAEFNDAQEAMLESAKETMETAKDMYLDAVKETAYELELTLTKGDGFDLLQDKYDHYIDTEERYLDTVNKIYETTKLNNKLQEQIDKTTNTAHLQRLKELQEEFNLREKNNKLSLYDIEIMYAKLAMLLKLMELEDAANNRSTLRLVRNSRGNYDYQFTANPDEIASVNQEYLDAAQEWYNIAKDKVKETTGEIVDTWQEMTEKIKEIYEDETLTVEEREARIAEIREYYTLKVKDLEDEKLKAIKDMTEAGLLAIEDFRDANKEVIDQMGEDVGGLKDIFADDLAAILGGADDFNNQFAEDMDNLSEEVENFELIFDTTIDNMNLHVDEYNQKIQDVNDLVGISYTDLQDILNQVSNSTEELTWRGEEAVQGMWNLITAAQLLSMQYALMADSVLQAARAMRELAQATLEAQFQRLGNINQVTPNPEGPDAPDYSSEMYRVYKEGLATGTFNMDEYNYWLNKRYGKEPGMEGIASTSFLNSVFLAAMNGSQLAQDILSDPNFKYFDEDWLKKWSGVAFATGGYTGDFDNGKLAILHEKELVLNQEDTQNILDAVTLTRSLDSGVWTNIAKAIEASAVVLLGLLMSNFSSPKVQTEKETLEQKVEITAQFPSVTDANEIEEALSNIINDAAQFVSSRD